ncbi:MAG: DNA polymerase III subunit gamma/tau [Aquisalimonadaceae bacterium]
MSYQVLARKYRPRTFAEMAGQEHVLRALINGLDNDRLHHAFLFTGTRGVGKTTVARVLAKCLNCEQGVSSTPCGECSACNEIDQGRFVDLIEVDAASRTKVEDTRELLDNVQYSPARGRYKIYLIDEVHMLSNHSFNALLKTLEEPPPHVKFLLATTDPQRMPVTVLSRCLQFNLKRLPASLISAYLGKVLGEEGVEAEERALQRLALAADGSMRDGLSLTDQAIAFGSGAVRDDDVRAMLGSIEDDHVLELLEALAAEDGAAVLAGVARLAERAPDFSDVLAAMVTTLHNLALRHAVPDAVDSEHPDHARLQALQQRLSPEDIQLYYQIALTGRRDLPLSPDPRLGLEMVLLRMLAFRPVDAATASAGGGSRPAPKPDRPVSVQEQNEATGDAPVTRPAVVQTPPVAEMESENPAPPSLRTSPEPPATSPPPAAPARNQNAIPPWPTLVKELKLAGMSHALAMQCAWAGYDDGVVRLNLDKAHAHLRNDGLEERIQQGLAAWFDGSVKLRIDVVDTIEDATPAEHAVQARAQRQQQAEQAIATDPNVTALREMFDAEVMPDSIQPVK